ncbi:MAG: Uma2 family endonuclease [Vicinamibacteria bacterium]|nr:Uma2 family endonuclease [Vicinamibacteria bacterium]
MATDPRPGATARDLDATPDDGRIYEILDGRMEAQPRSRPEHGRVEAGLSAGLFGPYDRGQGGPGGWRLVVEPEVALGTRDVVVPDLAGWCRERLPELPAGRIEVVPDWTCEVVSPSSRSRDRVRKSDLYLRTGVRHYWIVDPEARTLEALEAREGAWVWLGGWTDGDTARVAPFEAVEIDAGGLFVPLPPAAAVPEAP